MKQNICCSLTFIPLTFSFDFFPFDFFPYLFSLTFVPRLFSIDFFPRTHFLMCIYNCSMLLFVHVHINYKLQFIKVNVIFLITLCNFLELYTKIEIMDLNLYLVELKAILFCCLEK